MTTHIQIRPEATGTATTTEIRYAMVSSNAPQPEHIPGFVARDDLFFWTRAWQEGERESAEERGRGDVVGFESATDLMKWLLAPED